MQDIFEKTVRVLRLRNYSHRTRRAYLLYIKEYITFSKKAGIKIELPRARRRGDSTKESMSVDGFPRGQSLGVLSRCYIGINSTYDKFYLRWTSELNLSSLIE